MDGSSRPDILIVAGGDPFDASLVDDVDTATFVICADHGLDHAYAHKIRVDVAVGDFDSVSADALARAEADGVSICRAPADKDETDLALALELAARRDGPRRSVVVGAQGGRLDHELANLLLAGSEAFAALELELRSAAGRVFVVRDLLELHLPQGATLTLLSLHGDAHGVSVSGVRWPLGDVTLPAGSSWGVSNEALQPDVTVTVEQGVVLAVLPTTTPQESR